MTKRMGKLKNVMREQNLDSLIVSSPANCFYLTGFDKPNLEFRSLWLLITRSNNFVLTNPLHIHEAEKYFRKFDDFKVVKTSPRKSLSDWVLELCRKEGIDKIGFEANDLKFSEYNTFKSSLRPIKLAKADNIFYKLRVIKEEKEIKNIRKAQKITDKAFNYLLSFIKPGIRETDISLEIEYFMRKNGADEKSFDPIIASGTNSAIPHHKTSIKKIRNNEVLLLDFGCRVNGYCSDMTRTVLLGSKPGFAEAYTTVLKAQEIALKSIKPGIKCSQADAYARNYFKEHNLDKYFTHTLGHNLGLGIHEYPSLGPGSDAILEEGMVFSVEPGIYFQNKFGIRIEDIVVLRKNGVENLTKSPKIFNIL